MTVTLALILGILIGIALGAFAAARISAAKTQGESRLREQSETTSRAQIALLQAELAQSRSEAESRAKGRSAAETQLATASTLAEERQHRTESLRAEIESLRSDLQQAQQTGQQQAAQISGLRADLNNERQNLAEKLALLETAKQSLANQFEALAGELLEKKSRSFSEVNQKELGTLLQPLRDQLKDFREKVEQTHVQTQTGVGKLETLVGSLNQMNQQLAVEARELATALRKSSKEQGNWGEFILKNLLEKAGLRQGEHYSFQQSFQSETSDGKQITQFTDVLLHLPGGRSLVIDSKVTLVAWQDYANAENDIVGKAALKRHIDSVRDHVKGLSGKNYQKLYGIETPDFVVMFLPIETAYLTAMQEDMDLWIYAWERNILLVGPTTLLFVIRIVDNLWHQERQARNVDEVMERGAKLYEKFVGFIDDLEEVGGSLKKANEKYGEAYKKLSTGNDNLVRQVEKLRSLGVKPNKTLKPRLVQEADSEDLFLAAEAEDS